MTPPNEYPGGDREAADALRVTDVTFRRGKRIILDGVSWTVRRGQHWCILGPNGCGKTTLINIICGYEMATSGSVELDGARFGRTDWREVRKRVGLVTASLAGWVDPGEPVLNVVASGREAKLNLWQDPDPAWLPRAAELLEQVDCVHLSEERWGTLSQGERQKVLICRALMAEFSVLILDEPCAGLDPVARERFLGWLEGQLEEPEFPSLVMVTHHVEEILPAMGQVLLLREGCVLAAGGKADVLTGERLSALYGARVGLDAHGQRYRLLLKGR